MVETIAETRPRLEELPMDERIARVDAMITRFDQEVVGRIPKATGIILPDNDGAEWEIRKSSTPQGGSREIRILDIFKGAAGAGVKYEVKP